MSLPRPARSASVLVPTFQGGELFARLLDGLAAQETRRPWDVHVIDSGSTDGTLELLEARARDFPVPLTFRAIGQLEFDHGDTRNMLAAETSGALLVFLSQDAIPSRPDWLDTLARNFDDPRVGAAYCRNVPRADSELLTRVFCRDDPGYAAERREVRLPDEEAYLALDAEGLRVLYNFNNVASAVRRELWERHPFPRTMMGEDVLLGRAVLDAGWTVVYDADATVDHSHDYGPEKMHWRGEVDARFCAEWLDRICVREEGDVEDLARRLVRDDVAHLRELGVARGELPALEERALELRRASVRGLHEGSQAERRYPRSVMRERAELRIAFVRAPGADAHDAERLAGALRARGHEVQVLRGTRDLEALPAGSFPDVVHFLPLVPDTASGVELARAAGAAIVASVPDRVPDDEAGELDGGLPGGAAFLAALARADLQLTGDPAVRERYLAAAAGLEPGLDAHAFLVCSRLGPARDDGDARVALAAELEFRYRGAACIERIGGRPYGVLVDARGELLRPCGAAERQGDGWLLLRRGGSAELDVGGLPPGRVTFELEQPVLAAEPRVRLAGELLLDGRPVARIPAPEPDGRDRVERFAAELELPEDARTLALRPRRAHLLHRRPFLRIGRVRVRRVPNGGAGSPGQEGQ